MSEDTLSKVEFRVLLAVAEHPQEAWSTYFRQIYFDARSVNRARDRLVALGLVTPHLIPYEDSLGRPRRKHALKLNGQYTLCRTLLEWAEAGADPYRIPLQPALFRFEPTQRPTPRKVPGQSENDAERVLEAILRNPNAAWHVVRACTSLSGVRAVHARDDLITRKIISPDAVTEVKSNGTPYLRRCLVPDETHPLVQELRKRCGLRYVEVRTNATPLQPDLGMPPNVERPPEGPSWLGQLNQVLGPASQPQGWSGPSILPDLVERVPTATEATSDSDSEPAPRKGIVWPVQNLDESGGDGEA